MTSPYVAFVRKHHPQSPLRIHLLMMLTEDDLR